MMPDESTHHPLSPDALEEVAQRFKLLCEPTRLKILNQLMSGEKCVSDLVQVLKTSQANVSKQLGILAQGRIVARRKEGLNTYYYIMDDTIVPLCHLVCSSLRSRFLQRAESFLPGPQKSAESTDPDKKSKKNVRATG